MGLHVRSVSRGQMEGQKVERAKEKNDKGPRTPILLRQVTLESELASTSYPSSLSDTHNSTLSHSYCQLSDGQSLPVTVNMPEGCQ